MKDIIEYYTINCKVIVKVNSVYIGMNVQFEAIEG